MSRVPRVDACLIVRDESVNLPDCIESLKRLGSSLQRICVYDTGSADDTVAIARAAGCVVVEGYWDNDFARARNASLDMSRADWALIVDADERVVADPARLVRELTQQRGANVIDAELYHLDERGQRVAHSRYIKAVRPRSVRFVHPIHEIVTDIDGRGISIHSVAPNVMHFDHLGYASEQIRRSKAERNEAVADAALHVALQSRDAARIAHAYQHRGRSRTLLGRDEDALSDLMAAWQAWGAGSASAVGAGRDLIRRLTAANRTTEAMEVLRRLEECGAQADLTRLLLAEVLFALGHDEKVLALTADLVPARDSARETRGTVDTREVLGLRVKALGRLGRWDHVLATLLTLVHWGEVERVGQIVRMWRGSTQALAEILADLGTGPHGPAVLAALRASSGVGPGAADIIEHPLVSRDTPPHTSAQGSRAAADGHNVRADNETAGKQAH